VPSTYLPDQLTPLAGGICDGAHPRGVPPPPCPGSAAAHSVARVRPWPTISGSGSRRSSRRTSTVVVFESPQQAAAAGFSPSMDYASFARREQWLLSGDPAPTTTGAALGGSSGGYSWGSPYTGSGALTSPGHDVNVRGYYRGGTYVALIRGVHRGDSCSDLRVKRLTRASVESKAQMRMNSDSTQARMLVSRTRSGGAVALCGAGLVETALCRAERDKDGARGTAHRCRD